MVLLREEIGDVLRDTRRQQGRTLRQVSSEARVSLGYLSEVERGQKEASSELLASICGALSVPLSIVMHEVSERVAATEQAHAPAAGTAVVDRVDAVDTVVAPGDSVVDVLVPDTIPAGLIGDLDGLGDGVTELPGLRRPRGLVSAA